MFMLWVKFSVKGTASNQIQSDSTASPGNRSSPGTVVNESAAVSVTVESAAWPGPSKETSLLSGSISCIPLNTPERLWILHWGSIQRWFILAQFSRSQSPEDKWKQGSFLASVGTWSKCWLLPEDRLFLASLWRCWHVLFALQKAQYSESAK